MFDFIDKMQQEFIEQQFREFVQWSTQQPLRHAADTTPNPTFDAELAETNAYIDSIQKEIEDAKKRMGVNW